MSFHSIVSWFRPFAVVGLLLASACTDAVESKATVTGITIERPNTQVSVVVDGLEGPTQVAFVDAGRFLVAELGGPENDKQGRILLLEGPDEVQVEALFTDLDKPTGVTYDGNYIYVMERDRLSRGTLDGGPLEVLADDLPTNVRSEGTLTVLADGRILYNTSGRITDQTVVEDSGALWTFDPKTESIQLYASGFKNAYAHHVDDDNQLWVTEISDGSFDGEPAADGLFNVPEGAEAGWPSVSRAKRRFAPSKNLAVPPVISAQRQYLKSAPPQPR